MIWVIGILSIINFVMILISIKGAVVEEDFDRLAVRINNAENYITRTFYNHSTKSYGPKIDRDNFMIDLESRVSKIQQDLRTPRVDDYKVQVNYNKRELEKHQALLNELIDDYYSKKKYGVKNWKTTY